MEQWEKDVINTPNDIDAIFTIDGWCVYLWPDNMINLHTPFGSLLCINNLDDIISKLSALNKAVNMHFEK